MTFPMTITTTDIPMSLDYTKSGEPLLIDLINLSNHTLFKVGDLAFSGLAPFADDAKPEKNTKITATGTGTTRFKGPKEMYYARLSLSELGAARNLTFVIPATGDVLQHVLDAFNAMLGLKVEAADADLDNTAAVTQPRDAVLSAKGTSFTFIDQVTVQLVPAPTA